MTKFFNFLLFFLLCFWGIGNANAETSTWKNIGAEFNRALEKANSGATTFQESPFGKSRLISSRSGIKNTEVLLVGIEVILNEGWTLKQPQFTIDAAPYQGKSLPLFRPDLPASQNWTEEYEKYAIFPILLNGKSEEDINLTVLATWTACPPENAENKSCVTEDKIYTLTLSTQDSYTTVWRANIATAARMGAIDMKDTPIQVSNTLLDNGDLIVHFQFPEAVKKLDIRSEEPHHLHPTSYKPEGKAWILRFHSVEPLQIGDIISFSLRSTIGCYTLNLKVAKDPLPALPEKLPIKTILWIGFFFFVLSPIWPIWLKPQVLGNTPKTFNKNLIKLRLGVAIATSVLGALWIMDIDSSLWVHIPGIVWIVVPVLLYLTIRPVLPIFWACLGLVLLPRPFGENMIFVSNTTKVCTIIWCFICCYIPFNCWKLNVSASLSYFKKVDKEKIWAYEIFIRLPYMFLCGWLLLAEIIPFISPKDETSFTRPLIVRVTEPICLKCALDRMTIFPNVNTFGIHLKQVDSSSQWAEQKRKEHMVNRKSFNLLIWEDNREIILPPDLTRVKLDEILRQKN